MLKVRQISRTKKSKNVVREPEFYFKRFNNHYMSDGYHGNSSINLYQENVSDRMWLSDLNFYLRKDFFIERNILNSVLKV